MLGLDAVRHVGAHIADVHAVAGIADIDAGRIEPDANGLAVAVELAVVERRQHHVVHAAACRHRRHQRAHEEACQRGVAVGEVIDVGLPRSGIRRHRQCQSLESGIAQIARVGGRHGVAAEPEEAEGAALEAVRRLLAAAAVPGEIVTVARGLQDRELLVRRSAGERIAPAVVERQQLRLARIRDRERRYELGERPGIGETTCDLVGYRRNGGSPATSTSRPKASRAKNTPRESPSEG